MKLIGHDIVDLSEAARFRSVDRPRWRERVFSPLEMEYLSELGFIEHELWAFWAAKEAVFKAISRSDHSVRFLPTAFRVRSMSDTPGTYQVDFQDRSIVVQVKRTCDWIQAHVVSADAFYSEIQVTPYGYDTLLTAVSTFYGCPATVLRLEKDKYGIPWLYSNRLDVRRAITISHHGRFWSFGVGGGRVVGCQLSVVS